MKTFAVIGMGRFGRAVAMKLFSMGYEVLAVDTDTEKINNIAPFVTQAIVADAKEESVIKALGIRNYDCVVVAITEDIAASILITLHIKDTGVEEIICKARDQHHKKILEKIGADIVVIPEDEMGTKMAIKLVSKNFIDELELSQEYSVVDIKLPKEWAGKCISDLDIRKRYALNIIAVKNDEKHSVIVSPPADYVFDKDDFVIVVGKNSAIDIIR